MCAGIHKCVLNYQSTVKVKIQYGSASVKGGTRTTPDDPELPHHPRLVP